MRSMAYLIKRISEESVDGGFAETGVWQGGMSILTVVAMQLYGLGERGVYLCDSFNGLPPARKNSVRVDEKYTNQGYLRVAEEAVLHNFDTFGVPRERVRTVKGFFNASMPGFGAELEARGEQLAILRMDGD